MKKALLVAVLALTTAFAAVAQPRAIGGRIGWGVEVSYQHNLGDNFLELDLGLPGWGGLGIGLTGVYDFIIAEPEWTPGTWTFYAGPGLQVGSSFGPGYSAFNFGLVGQVGLSYKFEFPLELSVDLRPGLGIATGNTTDGEGNRVGYGPVFYPRQGIEFVALLVPCIGVRYAF
ncbi:MAG: hypothetical protein J6Y32_04870 [Bacteroidales bacterium]|nr:hypothetical protein [Bacteroidales bacterium]